MQILRVLGLFVLLWVLPQFLIRFQQLCTNCFMSACEGEKRPTPKGHLAVTNACIILLKIRAFSEIGLYLQKLMHIQVGSEINPHPMYRHPCQATRRSLLYHKLYHDFTFTSRRWHSDKLVTNAEDNHVRTLTGPFLQVAKCSQPPEVQVQVAHGPTALKNTSTIKLKHYGKLENAYKSRRVAISCILWKILFTCPTRDLNNHEKAWPAHNHEQNPLPRPSLWEIATMSRSSGEQPHDVKNTKEQALHQAQTMKTHKNVVCSQAIANRKKG